jgi:hypothetical protein
VLSTMTSSTPVQRAAQRRGKLHRARGDPRVPQAIAARHRLNTVSLAMTLPRRPVSGGDVHARAIERLDLAVDDRERSSEESNAAHGGPDERTAAVVLAAANEQVAAREAWVKYIEQGY